MTEIRLTRNYAAPPERVWTAFTDPAEFAAWFWPRTLTPVVELDVRVGGRWRVSSASEGMAVGGEYAVIEPPERLVMTWRWDGEETETLVTLVLAPLAGGGTALDLWHERFDGAVDRDPHAQGWLDCLSRLPGHLEGATEAG